MGRVGFFFFTEKYNETQKPGRGKDDDGKIIFVDGQICKFGDEHNGSL